MTRQRCDWKQNFSLCMKLYRDSILPNYFYAYFNVLKFCFLIASDTNVKSHPLPQQQVVHEWTGAAITHIQSSLHWSLPPLFLHSTPSHLWKRSFKLEKFRFSFPPVQNRKWQECYHSCSELAMSCNHPPLMQGLPDFHQLEYIIVQSSPATISKIFC